MIVAISNSNLLIDYKENDVFAAATAIWGRLPINDPQLKPTHVVTTHKTVPFSRENKFDDRWTEDERCHSRPMSQISWWCVCSSKAHRSR